MKIQRNFYSTDGKPYGCYELIVNYLQSRDSYFSYLEGEYCWAFRDNELDGEHNIYTDSPNRFYIKFEPEHLNGYCTQD